MENDALLVKAVDDDPQNFVVYFHVDEIAQEPNETFALELIPQPSTFQNLPTREGIFIRSMVHLTIIDSDCKYWLILYPCNI